MIELNAAVSVDQQERPCLVVVRFVERDAELNRRDG
jgi:hypothetical protein